MVNIQWYPGHMNKAKNEIQKQLKLVDVVLEVLDARVPESSRNPVISELIGNKKHIILLNKRDLADPVATKNWRTYYQTLVTPYVYELDAKHTNLIQYVKKAILQATQEKITRLHAKGVSQPMINAMCVGIPNSGKSTLLNRLVGKNVAVVGDRPGVTKNQNWLKIDERIRVLDTPGILWPKFDDQTVGMKLAITGAIKEGIFPPDDVALYLLQLMAEHYAVNFKQLVGDSHFSDDYPELLLSLTQKFGYRDDYDRYALALLKQFQKSKLGKMTLDFYDTND